MAILNTQLIKNYFRFFPQYLRKEVFLLISVFAFISSSAQITIVGDTKISGSENLHSTSPVANIYVTESTIIYNLSEEIGRIEVICLKAKEEKQYLKEESSQKPQNLAFQKKNTTSKIEKSSKPLENSTPKFKGISSEHTFSVLLKTPLFGASSGSNRWSALFSDNSWITKRYTRLQKQNACFYTKTIADHSKSASKVRPPPKLI